MTSSDPAGSGSLAAQIQELAGEVETGLIRLLDYYVHTLAAWQMVKDAAGEGLESDIDNFLTGTTISLASLAVRSDLYIQEEVIEACLGRLISLFEHWVFGLLRLWLVAYPEGIPEKDKKPVKLADILAASDKDQILRGVVEWELLGVAYKRPSEWFKYL